MIVNKIKSFKKLVVLSSSILLLIVNMSIYSASVTGYWQTIDDQTNEPKSILKIEKQRGDEYIAKVVKILKTDDGSDPETRKCDKCAGEKYNQTIKGMTVMWGVKQTADNEWSGGEILDPKTGKIYNVKFSIDEENNTLNVRGFIGFSLFGRTQVWYRINADK